MSGKGDSPRPLSVSDEQFGENFDRIDWSAHREADRKMFLGKQYLYVPNPLNGVEFNPDDFGVIAVDSE